MSTRPRDPCLLGVVNVSPESRMSDSIARTPDDILGRAAALTAHGVQVIDVGGRSVTPDVPMIEDAVEQRRLEPAVKLLHEAGHRLSVDTWSPETALRAIAWGVELLNYTGASVPDALLDAAAAAGTKLTLSYMPYGDAYRMRARPRVPYRMDAVRDFLAPRVERARRAGVREVVVDPNLGILHPETDDYQKVHLQMHVLANVERLRGLGCKVMLHAARKPEREARILFAEAVLRARPDYVRTHEPEILERLMAAARETGEETG